MARKNGNGEGSRPRERADGRWEARYWVGEKRRSVYGSTRKEAADKLARAIASSEEPQAALVPTNITVGRCVGDYDLQAGTRLPEIPAFNPGQDFYSAGR